MWSIPDLAGCIQRFEAAAQQSLTVSPSPLSDSTAHQLAIALTIKVLAARAGQDRKAVEMALYAEAEERAEEHGEEDELVRALRRNGLHND